MEFDVVKSIVNALTVLLTTEDNVDGRPRMCFLLIQESDDIEFAAVQNNCVV